MLRSTVTRVLPRSSSLLARPAACISTQQRFATAHAISNPTLANIEKRWEGMPPQEQAELEGELVRADTAGKESWYDLLHVFYYLNGYFPRLKCHYLLIKAGIISN